MARTAASFETTTSIPKSRPAAPFRHPLAWLKARYTERLLVRTLSHLSDRELADLGMDRHGIVEAIRGGRPNIPGAL
jgi:uncharacterized protein YjiS (DUF1127 family)